MHDKKRDLLWQTRIITEVYFFVVNVVQIDVGTLPYICKPISTRTEPNPWNSGQGEN